MILLCEIVLLLRWRRLCGVLPPVTSHMFTRGRIIIAVPSVWLFVMDDRWLAPTSRRHRWSVQFRSEPLHKRWSLFMGINRSRMAYIASLMPFFPCNNLIAASIRIRRETRSYSEAWPWDSHSSPPSLSCCSANQCQSVRATPPIALPSNVTQQAGTVRSMSPLLRPSNSSHCPCW
jgi:hypothetical protein